MNDRTKERLNALLMIFVGLVVLAFMPSILPPNYPISLLADYLPLLIGLMAVALLLMGILSFVWGKEIFEEEKPA